MSVHPPPSTAAGLFQPTWGRGLFALALAIAGFLLPQEVPLEWYPLNEPGNDINYLEISCASDKTGEVRIFHDLTHGMNELESIRFPISPTEQTYTYTFPLPDAPMVDLRVDPPAQGGTLTIRQMRIINRRGEEIRRFTRDQFRAEHEIASILPSAEGWKLTSTSNATNPSTRIAAFYPIIPVGKDHRNLLRCLLSTGYLAGMLLILLLAVLFTFHRPAGWRDFFAHFGFMAGLALLFAFVGNRGLIRNSVHYARYIPPPMAPGLSLEFDLVSSSPTTAQLFWDTGQGLNETESIRRTYESHQGLQTVRFPLSGKPLKSLRFDPRENEGLLEIRAIRIVDAGQCTRAELALNSLEAAREIAEMKSDHDKLYIRTSPGASDPITLFSAAAVSRINEALAPANKINRN